MLLRPQNYVYWHKATAIRTPTASLIFVKGGRRFSLPVLRCVPDIVAVADSACRRESDMSLGKPLGLSTITCAVNDRCENRGSVRISNLDFSELCLCKVGFPGEGVVKPKFTVTQDHRDEDSASRD